MPTVENAKNLATEAHAGQVDKAGRPYILHPAAVAAQLAEYGPDAVTVGWLHDVVEDTRVTLVDLGIAGYPDVIIDAIDSVTRREDETYMELVGRAAANQLGRLVKLADNGHNSDEGRLALLPDDQADRLRIKYAEARLVLLEAGGAIIKRSRDGQFAYQVGDRQITVTHLPSGETVRFVNSSLANIRKRAASGALARTIADIAYNRDHAQACRLGQHIGREILVDGKWVKVARCNGFSERRGYTNVWLEDSGEPLVLHNADYVRVREPAPSMFTVVGFARREAGAETDENAEAFTPLAVFAGSLPVGGRLRHWRDRQHTVVIEATTASKAEILALGAPVSEGQVASDAAEYHGPWTVVSKVDLSESRSLTPMAAIPGAPPLLHSPLASRLNQTQITVVTARFPNEALNEVVRMQANIDEDY